MRCHTNPVQSTANLALPGDLMQAGELCVVSIFCQDFRGCQVVTSMGPFLTLVLLVKV